MPNTGLLVVSLRKEGHFAVLYKDKGAEKALSEVYDFQSDISLPDLADQILEITNSSSMDSCQIIISIGGHDCIYRAWDFPFVGRQKVKQALLFELEEEIPFSEDTAETSLTILEKKKSSAVVSTTVATSVLDELLEAFRGVGLSVSGVLPAPFELNGFAAHMLAEENGAIMNIGADSVSWALVQDGSMVNAGYLPYGFSQGMQDIPLHDLPLIDLTDSTAEHTEEIRDGLEHTAMLVWSDIQSRCSLDGVEKLIICGDIVKFQGVDEVLSAFWQLNVSPLIPDLDEYDYDRDSDVAKLLPVLGVQKLLSGKRSSWQPLMLRSESKEIDSAALLKYSRWLFLLLFLGFCVLFQQFSIGLRYQNLADEVAVASTDVFKKAIPELTGKFGFTQMESILKERVDKLSTNQAQSDSLKQMKTLDFLLAVNKAVPAKLDVIVDSLSVDEGTCSLVGTAGGYSLVESLQKALGGVSGVQDVKIGSAVSIKGSKRVRFSIDVSREK
ncbi:MAG: type II secretion system protein GspL [Desulfovibrio sp.]